MRGTRQRGNAGSGTLECFFLNSEKTVCVPRLYGDMRATLKSAAQVFEWCRLSCRPSYRKVGPIGTFVVLITVARPCGSRRVGLSFLSRGK